MVIVYYTPPLLPPFERPQRVLVYAYLCETAHDRYNRGRTDF